MNDIPPEILKGLPGAAGSFVSMLFLNETWPRRIGLFVAGALLAYYGTPGAVKWTGLDTGFAGFLLGLFGMAVVAKAFDWWTTFNLGGLILEWLRKVTGLPAKEDT